MLWKQSCGLTFRKSKGAAEPLMTLYEVKRKQTSQFLLTGDPAQWFLSGVADLTSPSFSPSTVTVLQDPRSALSAFSFAQGNAPKIP